MTATSSRHQRKVGKVEHCTQKVLANIIRIKAGLAQNEHCGLNLLLSSFVDFFFSSECLNEVWKGDMGTKGAAEDEKAPSDDTEEGKTHDAGEL